MEIKLSLFKVLKFKKIECTRNGVAMKHKKIFLLMMTFLLDFTFHADAHEKIWPEKRLRQVWPDAQSFTSRQITLSSTQISKLQADGIKLGSSDRSPSFYFAQSKSSPTVKPKTIGIIIFIDESGDNGRMEITVAIGSDGQVKKVDLWEQSENASVNKDDFLMQFVGKTKSNSFILDKDYKPVKSAPNASAAVAHAVEKALKITNAEFEKK